MTDTPPGASPDRAAEAGGSVERVETPVEQVHAKGEAQAAAVAAAQEAGEVAEADLQALTDFVMDKADLEAGTCFGVAIPEGMLPIELARILCQVKAEKGLPLEQMPDAFIANLIGEKLTNLEARQDAGADRVSTNIYAAKFEALRAANTPNTEIIAKLADDPAVPEVERAKLKAFRRILAIAQAVPEDGALIAERLNQADFSVGIPSPVQFIQTAIFSSPDHDSGVSEATQAAIAGEFKLTPHRVVTGTDYDNAMNTTVTDEDGNEVPAYTEDNSLKFGVGLEGYTSDDGQEQFMKATPTHGHAITIEVTAFSANKKALVAGYLDAWRMAEDAGETDFLISLTQYDLRGQSVIDELQLIEAAQVLNAMYGGFTGYNGEVLRGDDKIGQTRWMAQLKSPKGDAARSDRNAAMTDDALKGLGIRDKDGNLDLDLLRAFGDYSRDNWINAPDYNDVQAHLQGLFPEKFDHLAVKTDLDEAA